MMWQIIDWLEFLHNGHSFRRAVIYGESSLTFKPAAISINSSKLSNCYVSCTPDSLDSIDIWNTWVICGFMMLIRQSMIYSIENLKISLIR